MILFSLLFFTLTSWAKIDLTLGLQGRTKPALGAEIYVDSGYNLLIWGKKKDPKDIMYGLIRPSLGASSSGVINSVKGELEFFPISFLGGAVGRQIMHSNYDFPFFNCDQVTCQGEYVRNYVEGKSVPGHKGWVAMLNYRTDTLRSPDRSRPMADWRNVLVGEGGTENQIEKKILVGKLFSNKMVGFLAEKVQFLGSREMKESFAAVYQVRRSDTSYMMGVGAFHTSRVPQGVILYFRIHYQALPSLKLF